jgi:thiamine-phosphate diphosphorylase
MQHQQFGKQMTLDRFYPIVDSADWVMHLVNAGAKLIQLRMKDASDFDIARDIERAKHMCEAAGAQLVVNDFWRAAIDAGCDYVHLGQGDLDTADIKAIRRAGIRIGVSTHDHVELDRALSLDRACLSDIAQADAVGATGAGARRRMEEAGGRASADRHRRSDA